MNNELARSPLRLFKASDIDENGTITVRLTSFNTEKAEMDSIYQADADVVKSFFENIVGNSIGEIGNPIIVPDMTLDEWVSLISNNDLNNTAGIVMDYELISKYSPNVNSGVLPIWIPTVTIELSKKALNLINSFPDMAFYFGVRSMITPRISYDPKVNRKSVEKICCFTLSAAPEYIPDEKGTEDLNKIKKRLADKMELYSIPNRVEIHTLIKARGEI